MSSCACVSTYSDSSGSDSSFSSLTSAFSFFAGRPRDLAGLAAAAEADFAGRPLPFFGPVGSGFTTKEY